MIYIFIITKQDEFNTNFDIDLTAKVRNILSYINNMVINITQRTG